MRKLDKAVAAFRLFLMFHIVYLMLQAGPVSETCCLKNEEIEIALFL
jgi:hypothetical protein